MTQRLSSALTVSYKVLPVLMAGACGLGILLTTIRSGYPEPVFVLFTVLGVLLGLFWSRPFKQVTALDDGLMIDDFSSRDEVPYTDIEQVNEARWKAPREVIIHLKRPCRFGTKIIFISAADDFCLPWEECSAARFLRDRIATSGK